MIENYIKEFSQKIQDEQTARKRLEKKLTKLVKNRRSNNETKNGGNVTIYSYQLKVFNRRF